MSDDRTTIMLLDDLHAIADELERRLRLTEEEFRLREQSQIPVIPRAAHDQMMRLEEVPELAAKAAPFVALGLDAEGVQRNLIAALDRLDANRHLDELELKGHTMAGPRIQPYRDAAGEYRWRRIAENGNIVADSGEGYRHKRECLEMARANFPDDPFDWALLPDPDALIDDGVTEDGDE